MNFQLRQLRGSGVFSYLLWEEAERNAVVVDPVVDSIEEVREFIAREGLQLRMIWETSPGRLAASQSAGPWLADERKLKFPPDRLASEYFGDQLRWLEADALKRRLLHVPGPGWVFTGDSVRMGASEPLPTAIADLPESTLLFPLLEERGCLFSNLEMERRYRVPGAEDFLKEERFATLNTSKYRYKLTEAAAESRFVDVREPAEFAEAHIPGTQNVPLTEFATRLGEFGRDQRIFLSCQSGRRSAMVAETLCHLGFRDVVNVSGGFQAWSAAGLSTESGSKS